MSTEKEEYTTQIDHKEAISGIKLRIKLKLSQKHLNENQSPTNTGETISEVPRDHHETMSIVTPDHHERISEVISSDSDLEEENSLDDDAPESFDPIPTCPECTKIFPSLKSLYGHLRSHPERRYRGVHKPLAAQKRPARPIPIWGVKAKRGRPDVNDDEEVRIAAETLMMMSQAKYPSDESLPKKVKCYQCSICDKSFPTHQALGGHRASHNKIRSSLEGEASEGVKEAIMEHRCKVCNENFPTGQALGGHMRRHYNFPIVKLENRTPNDFDLNKLAEEE